MTAQPSASVETQGVNGCGLSVNLIHVTMDPVWLEFRSAPEQFLSSHRTDVETLVRELLQVPHYPMCTLDKGGRSVE